MWHFRVFIRCVLHTLFIVLVACNDVCQWHIATENQLLSCKKRIYRDNHIFNFTAREFPPCSVFTFSHWQIIDVIWWRFKILISFCRKRILHVLSLPKIKVIFVSNTYFDAVAHCCRCGFGAIGWWTCMWIFPISNWRDYFINSRVAFSTHWSLTDINFVCTLHIHDNFV